MRWRSCPVIPKLADPSNSVCVNWLFRVALQVTWRSTNMMKRKIWLWYCVSGISVKAGTRRFDNSTTIASITHFFLMPDGQNNSGLTVVTVQRNIAAVTKVDQPLPVVLVHVRSGPANARLQCYQFDVFPNGLHSTTGRIDVLVG